MINENIKIYFDTEFTGLFENAKLISIGLVHEAGDDTFYQEVGGYSEQECSDFCKKEVLPHLSGDIIELEELQDDLFMWLHKFKSVTLICDNHKDMEQLYKLFPCGLPPHCTYKVLGFFDNLKRSFKINKTYKEYQLKPHHALDDARANRIIFEC